MKYFGTDGIRGVANKELTPELAFNISRAAAKILREQNKKRVVIGRDTRISGELIESVVVLGFLSMGIDVAVLGVIPTPVIAYITRVKKFDLGVVISASHNPFEYNGIKFFNDSGMKISDEMEEKIEELYELNNFEYVINEDIGKKESGKEYLETYVDFFKKEFISIFNKLDKKDFKILIDVGNGATYKIAEKIYNLLGLNFNIINNEPDGININKNCGSTKLKGLQEKVVKDGYDLGIAYDGDGDRCLAIDNNGEILDGDIILALIGKYNKVDAIVSTVMSNLGFRKFCEENKIENTQTKVGDRYVLEKMIKTNKKLGGEQSGHIIFLDYNPTGDGILTSIMLIKTILEQKKKINELKKIINIFPQVLINAKVPNDKKYTVMDIKEVKEKIEILEKEFKDNGRVLIRPSGTEPLVRVMIEGENLEYITKKAKELADYIEGVYND